MAQVPDDLLCGRILQLTSFCQTTSSETGYLSDTGTQKPTWTGLESVHTLTHVHTQTHPHQLSFILVLLLCSQVIGNCVSLLVLSSALPVFSRTLGKRYILFI